MSFQLGSDTMRLILVKPTNATRRLDSTGEVFHDTEHELCTSGGPSLPTKNPDGKHDRYAGSSVESSSSTQETSLHCVSPSPHKRSNGINPPQVSAQMSPLKTQNLTLSQLSDQDWLLLCGQVSSIGDDSPSEERAETSVGHQNHNTRCFCSCPDAHQRSETSTFQPQSKHVAVQDCLGRVTNKSSLFSSSYSQSFSQSTQVSSTCQVIPQQINQRDLLKPAPSHSQDNFMLQCSEAQRELLQKQTCNHFKTKDSSQAARPNMFNIPLTFVECTENQKPHQHPQPTVGKGPLLAQQRQDQDSHCLKAGNQTCKSCGDPSIILKCHHLPYNPLTNTQVKRSSTPASNKSIQSFSTSQFSSLENHDLAEQRARQQQNQVKGFFI